MTTELRSIDDQLIPSLLAAQTAAEFARAWAECRPRLVAADQKLAGLAGRTSDEARAASIRQLRTAIAGLLVAVDAEAGLTSTDAEALRAARAGVERARTAFSSALAAAEQTPRPASPEPSLRS